MTVWGFLFAEGWTMGAGEERAAMAQGSAVAERRMVIVFLGAKCPRCRRLVESGTTMCPRCFTTLAWPPIGKSEPNGGADD